MQVLHPSSSTLEAMQSLSGGNPQPPSGKGSNQSVEQAFQQFVGETFYSQMLSSMRKTVHKPAYFHGGQAEEIFRGQLDQTLAQNLAKSTAHTFTGPMFELFSLNRK